MKTMVSYLSQLPPYCIGSFSNIANNNSNSPVYWLTHTVSMADDRFVKLELLKRFNKGQNACNKDNNNIENSFFLSAMPNPSMNGDKMASSFPNILSGPKLYKVNNAYNASVSGIVRLESAEIAARVIGKCL